MLPDVNSEAEAYEEAPQEAEPQPEEKPEGEAPPEEAQAKPEGEEKPEGEGQPEDEDAKADAGEAEPQEKQKLYRERKTGGGFQRKIAQLQAERDLLMRQLQQNQGQPQPSKPEAEKTPEEKAAEYIESLVEKRLTERERQRDEQSKRDAFQRRTAEVRAQNPDFDDVVLAVDAPISPALEHALLTSEHGPAIMYELAKSPGELARVTALPPLDAAREIGRLEARFASATPPAKTTKPAFRPPAPPTSVNGSTASTRSLEDLPLSEYKRAMRTGRR